MPISCTPVELSVPAPRPVPSSRGATRKPAASRSRRSASGSAMVVYSEGFSR